MKWKYLVLNAWILVENVVGNNFTFTYNMAMRCKEHLAQHGYFYEIFYNVNDEDRKIVKSDPSIVFEMHLAILAASNGHILLSPVAVPDGTVPVYEFVVGGGANKFTELRGNLKRNARASAKTVGVLSPIEFRAFYIKITEDGLIEFGREGDILPILSYQDMFPTTVKYFSFAAWNGVEAKFLYDCPIPSANGTDNVAPNSKPIEPELSNSDMLRQTLLYNKNPYVPPRSKMNVDIGVKVTSISYNALDGILTTGISIVRKWTDDSMAWNPSKFNGTTYLTFRQGQIWRPSLSVFNTDSISMLDSKHPELIYMANSGEAILHMQTTVNTWCYDEINVMTRWPRDEYRCIIVIEPWELHEHITFGKLDTNSNEMKAFTGLDETIKNEWEMISQQYVINNTIWNFLYYSDLNVTRHSDRYIIIIRLMRQAVAYNIVFYTPLLTLVTFVLLSFWTEPLTMKRVWFYAGSIVVICMGLCYIDYWIPCHTIPTILALYTVVLGGVLLALIIHVALMTSLTKRLCKTVLLQNVLTAQWFRSLYCLPPLKVCEIYETVDECYEDEVTAMPRSGNVEEMQSDNTETSEAAQLGEAIDKTMFVIYSVVFAMLLALHF